jgi:hypothetical protein
MKSLLHHTCPFCFIKIPTVLNGRCLRCGGIINKLNVDVPRKEITMSKKKKQKKQKPEENTDEFWEVKIDCVEKCSKVPDSIDVFMKPLVKVKIQALMEKYEHIEWLAYLIGEKKSEKDIEYYVVNDLHIPSQKVSPGRVWDIYCSEYNELDIIGVMHSHHGMGTGFSGIDHEFINGNHNVSLVISKKQIAGQVRFPTPCGSMKIITDINIRHLITADFDKENFLETETVKIDSNPPVGRGFKNDSNPDKWLDQTESELNSDDGPVTVNDDQGLLAAIEDDWGDLRGDII